MKKIFLCVALILLVAGVKAQEPSAEQRPRLVVGIVVDQIRQEYLYRFASKFGSGGFKRMMGEGFILRNAHYNYTPTVTGPGHASIYTGTTPAIHGIIGNEWYDKQEQRDVNCVFDPKHSVIGGPEGTGKVSPWRLQTTTITDELKLATQKRSKVIGISIKDRGAVLPAGHLADGAYWYDGKSGRFISSTYYFNAMPDWVVKFNQLNLADKYLSQEWKPVLPIEQYTESGPDDSPYEGKLAGQAKRTFPYNLAELRKSNGNFDLLVSTPFGNDYLTAMAKAAIEGEKLGADTETDFLSVSYSSPDILGHAVGPNAVELQDMYIRLDKNLEDLMKFLDSKVGKDQYTLFLTADHGVADVAQYFRDSRIPAGYFNAAHVKAGLSDFLKQHFPGREIIESFDGDQLYFNSSVFEADPKVSGIEFLVASELSVKYLLAQEGVANAYSEGTLRQGNFNEGGIKGMAIRGYHPKRSGDVIVVLESGWYGAGSVTGTTHGSPYTYDTHVPVIFYGKGIRKGHSVRYHTITDIAPSLSVLLGIKLPSGCTGNPVEELFQE